MNTNPTDEQLGKHLAPGTRHYRAFVSHPDNYDIVAALQFNLLTSLGLREYHYLLDIGCGSLRGGRLFIPYLLSGHYFGIEPEPWLIEEGIKHELGDAIIALKKPTFSHNRSFNLEVFNRKFDFLLAQSIFSHASAAQIRTCVASARKVMEPHAIFVANFVESHVNYEGDEWVYPGGSYYTMNFMRNLIAEEGLACVPIDWPHPVGLRWILIVHPDQTNRPFLRDMEVLTLRAERDAALAKLRTLEQHPYVRFGRTIRRWALALMRRQ
ncbi:MAG: class I SAM-dependent methyltransferase [Chloroflexus sp.]